MSLFEYNYRWILLLNVDSIEWNCREFCVFFSEFIGNQSRPHSHNGLRRNTIFYCEYDDDGDYNKFWILTKYQTLSLSLSRSVVRSVCLTVCRSQNNFKSQSNRTNKTWNHFEASEFLKSNNKRIVLCWVCEFEINYVSFFIRRQAEIHLYGTRIVHCVTLRGRENRYFFFLMERRIVKCK